MKTKLFRTTYDFSDYKKIVTIYFVVRDTKLLQKKNK